MAAADPALPSPLGTGPPYQRADRRQNASPPPQSKRDRKRQAVVEKIAFLTEKFNQNRDAMYREHLHQIQIDTSLVLQANPYTDRPLDGLTAGHRKEHTKDAQSAKSLLGMAGPRYLDWVHEIEDLVEHRDFDLTRQKHEYERKCSEYRNTHAYRVEVAKREHKTLSDTLRDRLINVITSKKVRLNKEKEALDVSDASALLLHPNQFTHNNPASPSGNHGKRATRLRRDADDISGYDNGKKRKRAANDDDGSPAPSRQRLDPNGTTSLWQTDRMKSMIGTGKTAFPPEVYSLEKLFTEKELTMTHNTAALVAHKHIQTHPVGRDGLVDSPSGSTDTAGNEEDEHLAAPMMERHHSTRSTRGGHAQPNLIDDKVLGQDPLQTFDNINLERISFQEPKLPPMAGFQYNKGYGKSNEVNTPLPLPQDEVNSDLAVIDMFKRYEETRGPGANFAVDNGGRQLLEAGTKRGTNGLPAFYRPSVDLIMKTHPQGPTSNMRDETNNTLQPPAASHLHTQAATSAPMSRQSSLGDVGMSRQGSGRGKRRI